MAAKKQHPLSVRIDPVLLAWLKAKAQQGDRSLNAQINRLIREAKESHEDKERH